MSATSAARLKAFIAAVIWGASFVATKTALREVHPVTIIVLRFGIGVLVLAFAVWRLRVFKLVAARDMVVFALQNFAATQIGIIFLDTDLNIQRFTPPAKKIVNLIESDIGRPIRHIVHNLEYERLVEDAQEVLRTLRSKDIEVRSTSGNGNWNSMRVHPYWTTQNRIEGVVVTFIDIQTESERK